MSVTVTKGEGVTVFTVTSDPTSNCPLLCQLLRTLFCSSACVVSQGLRKLLAGTQSALGTIQIMVGLFTIAFGAILLLSMDNSPWFIKVLRAPYWLGVMFIVSGIFCFLADGFPSPCLVTLTVFINMMSTILAVTAIVFYLVDEGGRVSWYCRKDSVDPIQQNNLQICLMYKPLVTILLISLKVMLVVFAALEFCVTISVAVLGIKALTKNKTGKDSELQEPFLEEEIANPTV